MGIKERSQESESRIQEEKIKIEFRSTTGFFDCGIRI